MGYEHHGYDAYRVLLEQVADWKLLADVADEIYHDDRLSWGEKDTLFSLVDAREMAIQGLAVRFLRDRAPRPPLVNA